MVFCNGHIIVIYYNDQIAFQLCSKIKSLQSFSATEGTITDHSDHIFPATVKVASFCQTACQTDRGRSMSYRKMIVLTLLRTTVSGHIIIMLLIQVSILSACKHLMWICLMGYIIHDLILRGFKYIMERDCRLHHTKVWSEMTAMNTCPL